MIANARHDQVRERAFDDLRRYEVVMEGHFDYGNGFHSNLYLNPHQLFQFPSTIWRVAQDLIDVMPSDVLEKTEIVAGPATISVFNCTSLGITSSRSWASRQIVDGWRNNWCALR